MAEIPYPSPDTAAFFIDFDGTLVELAEHPDAVMVPPEIIATLERLYACTSGAVAVISGRQISALDQFLAPLQLPAAGVHGLERRGRDGLVTSDGSAARGLDAIRDEVTHLSARHEGLLIEDKGLSLAVHYRQRPELAQTVVDVLETWVAREEALELKHGKMVCEVKPAGRNKGTAVADFLAEPPFHGRLPVFAGDDVTDEDAFSYVNGLNGLTLKIGDGATQAVHRCADPRAFHEWLAGVAAVKGAGTVDDGEIGGRQTGGGETGGSTKNTGTHA